MKATYRLAAAAALAFVIGSAAPAAAQTIITADPSTIRALLLDKGYRAELGKDGSGDPMITSGVSGAKFVVMFYGCTNHLKCTNITFYAGFENTKMTIGDMNEWNKAHRFSRAYIDKDGDPCLEGDVDLDIGGMSKGLFLDYFDTWTSSLGKFRSIVYPK